MWLTNQKVAPQREYWWWPVEDLLWKMMTAWAMLTASFFWHWRLTAWGHGHQEHHRSHLKVALEKGKKKQCNQREEDTGQDRQKHSCCPVHHTPNCFNRTCAACCLYVVCPHRHNGMNNYLWCGTCDYQIQSPMSLAFGFGMLLPCFQLYNESWTALSEAAISKIKFTR